MTTDTDLNYLDEEEPSKPAIDYSEIASQAAVPAVGLLLGAALGTLIGKMVPPAGIALALVGAFGGQLPKHPAFKALLMGASAGLLGGAMSNAITPNGTRMSGEKPTPKQALREMAEGLKTQWPFNKLSSKGSTENESTPKTEEAEGGLGSVVGDPEMEFQKIMHNLSQLPRSVAYQA